MKYITSFKDSESLAFVGLATCWDATCVWERDECNFLELLCLEDEEIQVNSTSVINFHCAESYITIVSRDYRNVEYYNL